MVWLECGGCESCLEARTQLIGKGLRGFGNLAVGGPGGGKSGLVLEQGEVCLIWVFGSFAHSCLDSAGWQAFLGTPLCASSGPSSA